MASMTTDARDLAIQATCPVVAVPRFGELAPHAGGQRMLLGSNGLFVQMTTPWLECTTRVGEVGMRLPFGAVAEAIRFAFGVIPRGLLEDFIRSAREALPNEVAGALTYDTRTGGLQLKIHEAIAAGPGHVSYRIGVLADHELLAIDLHSHGRLPAFWSGEDDRDDQGVRVCGVFGNLDRERPSARFRLVLNGLFRDLAHPWEAVGRVEQVMSASMMLGRGREATWNTASDAAC
jgi:PRTRC genetic system protein A